jgi:hypothetical protein
VVKEMPVATTRQVSQDERGAADDMVLRIVRDQGPQTLEGLVAALPRHGWSSVFLAVDRLSRSGRIILKSCGRVGYQVVLRSGNLAG